MDRQVRRLLRKSRFRRLLMIILGRWCTESIVTMKHDTLPDYLDPEKKTTDLFLEFHTQQHVFRFGRGSAGLFMQFNVTQVRCERHFLDLDLKYQIAAETFYGLSSDEYFKILKTRIGRLTREKGPKGRWYVKKRKLDYHSDKE